MDLSDIYPHSNQSLCKWSPDGKFMASVMQYRLVIREANTQEITQLFTCIEEISFLAWSPDSLYVLCGMYKRAVIQIWSIEHPDWSCKIDEGPAGISNLLWSPDSRHVLSVSEFQVN